MRTSCATLPKYIQLRPDSTKQQQQHKQKPDPSSSPEKNIPKYEENMPVQCPDWSQNEIKSQVIRTPCPYFYIKVCMVCACRRMPLHKLNL